MQKISANIVDVRGVFLRTEQVGLYSPQPEGAIYTDPPEPKEGLTRMWINGAWQQVPDADVPPLPEPSDPESEVPAEVPRYCGLLALKRHRLVEDDLQQLDALESWESGSLYADVLAFRTQLLAGEQRDRLDVALNDVNQWTLASPTVADLCAVLALSTVQRDELFCWAKTHEATL